MTDSGSEREALELFQGLLRIDTSNPPGNETPAAELCARALRADRIESVLLGRTPERQNVIARVKGDRTRLKRDVIFCGSCDEEAGSAEGATWLVDKHAELVAAEYGMGEVGGFS